MIGRISRLSRPRSNMDEGEMRPNRRRKRFCLRFANFLWGDEHSPFFDQSWRQEMALLSKTEF